MDDLAAVLDDMSTVVARVGEYGGEIIHPGEQWTICKDSEGNPFALAQIQTPA